MLQQNKLELKVFQFDNNIFINRMELIPKNYEKDLDLIILFSNVGSLYSHICNRRP